VSDERQGLPSASSAARYAVCPGSFLLEQEVTEAEVSSSDATTGNRIHSYLAGEIIQLPDEEQRIASACRAMEDTLRKAVFPFETAFLAIRERRLWDYDKAFEKAWSGKPDVVYYDEATATALVIDYKTGRGTVEHATGNVQLRALAVLVNLTFGPFRQITVAIIQPSESEPTTCTYGAQDLVRAEAEMARLMESVRQPGQPRVPSSDGCKYCRAKPICPEARGVVETLPATVQKECGEIVMSPEQIAAFLDKIPLAEAVIESVRGKARRILEAGGAIPGWKLKPGAVRESITKPEVVFGRFVQAGGTQEQFAGAITITKTKFRDAVKTATGSKGKALDELVEGLLEDCTEQKATSPSIIKEKATE